MFSTGTFPDRLKFSEIKPIYKKGDKRLLQWIKIVLSSTQGATLQTTIYHVIYFWNVGKKNAWISNRFNNMCCLQNYFEAGARGRDVCMHTMKAYMGSWDINPSIHNIIIRWRSLVSLTLWPLYSHSNSPSMNWIVGWVGPRIILDV